MASSVRVYAIRLGPLRNNMNSAMKKLVLAGLFLTALGNVLVAQAQVKRTITPIAGDLYRFQNPRTIGIRQPS